MPITRALRAIERAVPDGPQSDFRFCPPNLGRRFVQAEVIQLVISFHYNIGAIRRATPTRLHRARDYRGALAEFARWNRAGGRVMKGLVRHRAAEARLYSAI